MVLSIVRIREEAFYGVGALVKDREDFSFQLTFVIIIGLSVSEAQLT